MDGIEETLLAQEVRGVAKTLVHADQLGWLITDTAYAEWQDALNKAFDVISAFATAHNIDIE